jgi:hypothetical protein
MEPLCGADILNGWNKGHEKGTYNEVFRIPYFSTSSLAATTTMDGKR